MKTKKFLWALLPMMAAALMTTACSSDDDSTSVSPKPAADQTVKSIPYTVTVGQGTTTRAGVASDDVTLKFAEGDKLYVQDESGNVYACLDLQSGTGAASATFSGDLYYTGSAPAAGLMLTATLVGANDQLATVSDSKVTGFKAYPTSDNICATMADAVAKYSKLTGSNTYGAKRFALSQQTAFLKFKVILEDGTTPGDNAVAVTVQDGNTTLGTGTTVASGTAQFTNTYAEFVLPAANNTSVSTAAKMWVGSVGTPTDESIAFGASSAITLAAGYVYEVPEKTKDFVRLWADGPLWRTRNIGATSVTDIGSFYQWGGTEDLTNGYAGWEGAYPFWVSGATLTGDGNVKFNKYVPTTATDNWGGSGSPDNKTTLEAIDDAATKSLGSLWRMPTYTDFENLITNTDYAWIAISDDNNGGKLTGKGAYASKAMFMTAKGGSHYYDWYALQNEDGYYWSSSLYTDDPRQGWGLKFYADGIMLLVNLRNDAHVIRPVRN